MTRLNVRLLVIVGISFLVLTVGVVAVHAIQMRSNVDSIIKRADAIKSSDPRAALRLYALYRSYKPEDIDVFADYAEAAADVIERPGANSRDLGTAFAALEQVLTYSLPAEREAELRKRLIKLDLATGRFAAAKDHLQKLKNKKLGDSTADLQLAQVMISTGDYMNAVQLLSSLIGYDGKTKTFDATKAQAPKEVKAYSALAVLLRDKDVRIPDRAQLADGVIDQMVAANPDSALAYLIKAQFLRDKRDQDGARQAIEKARALEPDNADVLLQAIDFSFQSQDFTTADQYIAKAIELYPKDDRFAFEWVLSAEAQKNPDEAGKRLEQGLARLPSSPRLLDVDFNRRIQKNDLEGAENTLKRMGNARIDPDIRGLAEAKLWFAQHKLVEARDRLLALQPKFAQRPELAQRVQVLLNEIYMGLGQYDRVQKTSVTDNVSLENKLIEATSLIAAGKPLEALPIYEAIGRFLDQQNALMKTSQFPSTLLQLRIVEQMSKPREKRDWSKIDELLAKMRDAKVLPEPNISILEVDVLNRKGEVERARQAVQDLRNQFPKDATVWAVSVGLELQDKKLDAANRLLAAAPSEIRSSPALYGARLETLFSQGKSVDQLKPEVAQLAEEVEKSPKEDRARLYPVLGTVYIRLGDRDLAMQYFRKATGLLPNDSRVRWMMFETARQTGDLATLKELQTWYASNSASDRTESKLIEATILVVGARESSRKRLGDQATQITLNDQEKKDLASARAILREISSQRPDWIEEPRLLAEVDILESRLDDAVSDLRRVMDRGQPTPQVVTQLVRLLSFRQRYDEAKDLLDQFGALVNSDDLKRELYIQSNDVQKAVDMPFNKDSTVWTEHLLHGKIMAAAKRGQEAENDFRNAVKYGSDEPQAWLALIGQLVDNKKSEEALKTVQRAQIELPEDRRALVLAQGYEMVADFTQSERYYLAALEATPKDTAVQRVVAAYYLRRNQTETAKKYLDDIRAAEPVGAAKDNIAWARRVTAQLLATSGTYTNFRKGLDMLTPPPGEKSAPEDLAVKISLLVNRSDPSSTREALRLFEQLKELRPLNWQERLGMATLYERVGKWQAARDEMLSLIAAKPDPAVYIAYVEMLLRHGQTPEAAELLGKVLPSAAQSGNSFPLAMLMARTLTMQNRGPEAAKLLLGFIPAQRPLPEQQRPILGEIAAALEQIGQYNDAEKLWREYVTADPGQVLQLAGFLAREGKIDAALDLAEQYRRAFPAAQLLDVGTKALHQSFAAPTPEQVGRIEKWFDRAIQEDPDSLTLQTQLADLRDFQRNYKEAEKLYRAILARSDTPAGERAVVMNNLAFLLAMQGRDMDEALKLINEAIDIFGPQSDMLDTRGVVLLRKGEVKKALDDLNDAVIVTGPSGIKYVHLAMAQAKANELGGARHSLDKAKELNFKRDDLSPLEKPEFESLLKQLNKTW